MDARDPDVIAQEQSPHESTDEAPPAEPTAPQAPRRRKESLWDDPVIKWLSIGLGVVLILFLSSVLAALYLGVLGSDLPKTALDRDLQTYEFQTAQGSRDPEVWRSYVSALVNSNQLRLAQQVIDRGTKVVEDQGGADMTFAQAQVYFSSKKYEQAIEQSTKGMEAILAYHEKMLEDPESPQSRGQEFNQNYWGMLYLRANSYVALKQYDKAIADFDEYLDERGGASDVYTLRGDAKALAGDDKGAEEDYRTALKFIEDYEPALEGLEELGVKP